MPNAQRFAARNRRRVSGLYECSCRFRRAVKRIVPVHCRHGDGQADAAGAYPPETSDTVRLARSEEDDMGRIRELSLWPASGIGEASARAQEAQFESMT